MVDDLQALSRLRDLAMLSVGTAGLEPILAEVLDSAIAISGADFGNVQLIDPVTSDLRIAAQRGFPAWWIDFWNIAAKGHGVCGSAVEHKARVIVEDVKESPLFVGKPTLDVQLRANVRAVHSTPLLSREGQAVGVLSVHHRKPHRPDDRVLRWFDLLSRQAADMIDSARVTAALRDSESRFRALAVASWDVLYRMSPDWYQMRSLEGKGFIADTPQATEDWLTRYIPPDDQPLVVAAVRRAIETKGLLDLEHRVRRVDGTLAWIHSRAVPLLSADGQIVEWFGAARDVTEARQSQARLFEEEQRLQALLQSLPVGVAFTNSPDCAQVQGNPALLAQFGAGPGDNVSASAAAAGSYGPQIVYLRDGMPLTADELPLQRAAREGRLIEPMELDVRLPSGRQFFTEVSGAPIRNMQGELIGAVTVSTDISERKRAAETREQARLKDEFLAVLGHELRNPLAALSGAVDAMAGDLSGTERDAMDQLIRRQVGVLRRLVDDLLDIARITHGKIRLQKEPFSLAELLGAASAAARVATDQRAQRLSAVVRGADVLFEADRVRLQQVVANLLDNASKYSGQGGTIELTGALEGSEIVLRCKDSGSGMRRRCTSASSSRWSAWSPTRAARRPAWASAWHWCGGWPSYTAAPPP